DVVFYTLGAEPAFLAQRFVDRPVTHWKRLAEIGVDSASVCVVPRMVVENVDGGELQHAEESMRARTDERWQSLQVGTTPILGFDVCDDGTYDLYMGLDADDACAAWVLVLGATEQPDWEPAPKPPPLSRRMAPFVKTKSPFSLAARRRAEVPFGAVAK